MLNRFPHTEIEKKTIEYLLLNYGEEGRHWVENIDDTVALFAEKWELTYIGQEEKSRFGCILYVGRNSEEYVLKLIPPCCERLYAEIKCYFDLPYSNMLELIDYDVELGGFLIKRISDKKMDDLRYIRALFQAMHMQRREAEEENGGLFVYADSFEEALARATNIIKESADDDFEVLLGYIEFARKCFINHLSMQNKYLLHGDAHIHNILFDGENVFLIDPIGYIGPFEIEYARFLGTYIRENNITQENIYSIIEYVKSDGDSIVNILYSLGLDVTMRACNTFFEGDSKEGILDAIKWCQNVWELVNYCLCGDNIYGEGSTS